MLNLLVLHMYSVVLLCEWPLCATSRFVHAAVTEWLPSVHHLTRQQPGGFTVGSNFSVGVGLLHWPFLSPECLLFSRSRCLLRLRGFFGIHGTNEVFEHSLLHTSTTTECQARLHPRGLTLAVAQSADRGVAAFGAGSDRFLLLVAQLARRRSAKPRHFPK